MTDEQIARAWFGDEYGPGHTKTPGYVYTFLEALAASTASDKQEANFSPLQKRWMADFIRDAYECGWRDHSTEKKYRGLDIERKGAEELAAILLRTTAAPLANPSDKGAEQEPVAWIVAGELREEHGFHTDERAIERGATPLFTHPTPDDAKDAARYRFLRKKVEYTGSSDWEICINDRQASSFEEAIDAAIDRAMQDNGDSNGG